MMYIADLYLLYIQIFLYLKIVVCGATPDLCLMHTAGFYLVHLPDPYICISPACDSVNLSTASALTLSSTKVPTIQAGALHHLHSFVHLTAHSGLSQ